MYIHTSSILYCNTCTPVSKLILHVFITENGNLHIYKGDMDVKKIRARKQKCQITTRNKRKIILIIYRLVQNKHKLH